MISASVQSFVKCDLDFPTQGLEHVVRPQQVHVGGALAIVLPRALPDVLIGRVISCDGAAEAAELLEAAAPTVVDFWISLSACCLALACRTASW